MVYRLSLTQAAVIEQMKRRSLGSERQGVAVVGEAGRVPLKDWTVSAACCSPGSSRRESVEGV